MSKVPYVMKITAVLKQRLKAFCEERGIKQGYFVEKAIEEKLDREEDLEDSLEFKRFRHELPLAQDFEEFLKGHAPGAKAR